MTKQATQTQEKTANSNGKRKGLVMVHTGIGKGKTTAALGMIFRAWGRGMKVGMVQFLKRETGSWGEVKAAQKLGIDWVKTGDGFTWTSRDMDETIAKALHGWEVAQEMISAGQHDLLVLDEFTYLMAYDWVDTADVIDWLKKNKPPAMHLVITGRDAPQSFMDYADLVTEMQKIKHPYDEGITAQPGVEF
jgi:cob(I)alamin adenosyltransferase